MIPELLKNEVNMKRRRKNEPERLFEEMMLAEGNEVTKRGWPDFIITRPDGTKMVVEVKPRFEDVDRFKYLKREQTECMKWLTECGVECFVSDGKTIEPFRPERHSNPEHS